MSKLYFRYGTVDSAKSLNLLAVAHKYEAQGKKVKVLKPAIDTRWGVDYVTSRVGVKRRVDYVIGDSNSFALYLLAMKRENPHCVLVDEAQFLESDHIDLLRSLVSLHQIPVICYGLRCDFRGAFFDGAMRLMEVADSIEEIKTTCNFCNSKAIMNLKTVNGKFSKAGPSVELGGSEKYVAACWGCWNRKLNNT